MNDDDIIEGFGIDEPTAAGLTSNQNGESNNILHDDDQSDDDFQDWSILLQSINNNNHKNNNNFHNSISPNITSNSNSNANTINAPVVPKRGEKGYEPTSNNYDNLLLQNKREIMYTTIANSQRGHHHKNHVEAFWINEMNYAIVPKPKGSSFNNLALGRTFKNTKYLTFEEVLYMVERGNIECFMIQDVNGGGQVMPMSLQTCYAMLLKNHLDYDIFYVYSYLKRYGYVVHRAENSILAEGKGKSHKPPQKQQQQHLQGLKQLGLRYFNGAKLEIQQAVKIFTGAFHNFVIRPLWSLDTLRPLLVRFEHLVNRLSWSSFYKSINFIPYQTIASSTYEDEDNIGVDAGNNNDNDKFPIFFNVWKPNNQLRVDDLQRPDYQLIIINTNYTKLPTVQEIQKIYKKAYNKERIIMAIVDNGMLNFIKLNSSDIGGQNIFLKQKKKNAQQKRKRPQNGSKPPKGKK